MTLSGPQRDELRLMVNGRDLGLFGSRGQARTAVMALKLAELGWMRDTLGEWPVLLLDEVIAELDAGRRAYLLDQVNGVSQALLTTTEPDIFTEDFLRRAARWHVHRRPCVEGGSAALAHAAPAAGLADQSGRHRPVRLPLRGLRTARL